MAEKRNDHFWFNSLYIKLLQITGLNPFCLFSMNVAFYAILSRIIFVCIENLIPPEQLFERVSNLAMFIPFFGILMLVLKKLGECERLSIIFLDRIELACHIKGLKPDYGFLLKNRKSSSILFVIDFVILFFILLIGVIGFLMQDGGVCLYGFISMGLFLFAVCRSESELKHRNSIKLEHLLGV